MNSRSPTPGSQTSLREANRARIVDSLKHHGHFTQVELVGATGLLAAAAAATTDAPVQVRLDLQPAAAEHQRLLGWEKEFIEALEIPYQVLELAAGDLGLSAARKYDCYGWLPTQDRYREITSTSNCTEFQARRLNVRARFEGGTGPVATLNGTLCAMTRTIIMILENHQQADGSVRLPAALRPFLGGREALTPR